MVPYLRDKIGLEIGGPSRIFAEGRLIPVYNLCRRIDNCNFASQTIWSSTADDSGFDHRLGKQFVAEASDLSILPDGRYDFVLASHALEHVANPLRALQEWKRILGPNGALVVIVPDKRATFDHKRAFTTFEHVFLDNRANTPESDLTHISEILALHDLGLDPGAGSSDQFRKRCLANAAVRAMHHHVFSIEVLVQMFTFSRLKILSLTRERPGHVVVFAKTSKPLADREIESHNSGFLADMSAGRKIDLPSFSFPPPNYESDTQKGIAEP